MFTDIENFHHHLNQYLKDHLTLDVKTSSHMEGCGDYRWVETHTVQLILEGEVIGEASIG
jgi:quinol monooxygenase YgiN